MESSMLKKMQCAAYWLSEDGYGAEYELQHVVNVDCLLTTGTTWYAAKVTIERLQWNNEFLTSAVEPYELVV